MKIFVDISGLTSALGVSLTGIQRVEYNMAKFLLRYPEVEYCLYVGKPSGYKLIPRNLVDELIKEIGVGGQIDLATVKLRRHITKRSKTPINPKPTDILIIPQGFCNPPPYLSYLAQLSKKVRLIQVVHDAIHRHMPEARTAGQSRDLIRYMSHTLPLCYRIAPNSKHTAMAIEADFRDWSINRKPRFIQCTFGADITADQPQKPAKVTQHPYYLTVSTLNYGKNIHLLMQVYRLAQEQGIELPHLYIAGQVGFMYDEMTHQLDQDIYLKTKITRLGPQNNRQVIWLYQNARLTIFASFYEAYGLPLAESLTLGKVSLSSDKGALPEVGGKFADYFSPYSPEQLLKLLVKYQDQSKRKQREADIKAGYSHPTWREAVEDFYSHLQALGAG